MKVIATYQQKTEPGKNSAMKGSVAEDKRKGSSATRSVKDHEVFANDLLKGAEFTGHISSRFAAPHDEHGRQGAHAGERSKLVPPTYNRIQNGPEGRAESDTRGNSAEHSAHGPPLHFVGIAVPDSRQRDGDDPA